MPYESPVLEITNFSLERGASSGGGGGEVCKVVGGDQEL